MQYHKENEQIIRAETDTCGKEPGPDIPLGPLLDGQGNPVRDRQEEESKGFPRWLIVAISIAAIVQALLSMCMLATR